MMGWGYMGSGGAWMAALWVMMLLLLIGLTTAVIVIMLRPHGQATTAPPAAALPPATAEPPSAAEAELELRYARGEIDAATLTQQRAVLRQR